MKLNIDKQWILAAAEREEGKSVSVGGVMTKPELVILLADDSAFRAWLKAQEPGEVVGIPYNRHHCPLCFFLRAHGAENPEVCLRYALANHKDYSENPIDIPSWVVTFQCDALDLERSITASECLVILDDIAGGETDGNGS